MGESPVYNIRVLVRRRNWLRTILVRAVMLRIETVRWEPDITLVELAGRITMGEDSRRLEEVVLELLREDRKKIIFDMTAVDYVDSTGMGSIAYCFAKVMRAEGGFRVAGLNNRVKDLFRITRMEAVLPCYPTLAEACADFTVTPVQSGQNPW